MNVAVLASGAGTNLQALIDRAHGRDGVELVAVASDKPGAPALRPRSRGGDRRPRRSPPIGSATGTRAIGRSPRGCTSAAPSWSCSPATCSW